MKTIVVWSVLLSALLVVIAWGQQPESFGTKLDVLDATGSPGVDVWVTINATIPAEVDVGGQKVALEVFAGQFNVVYDPAVLTCKEVKPGSLLGSYQTPPPGENNNNVSLFTYEIEVDENNKQVGMVHVAFSGTSALASGMSDLIKMRFGVDSGFKDGDETVINIEDQLLNEDIVPEIDPGKITYSASGKLIPVKVVDVDSGNAIVGATVELRAPNGSIVSSATTGSDGTCKLGGGVAGTLYTVRAYKEPASAGYFPSSVSDVSVDSTDTKLQLKKIPDVKPTDKNVDFYGSAKFEGKDLLVGDVIVAKDPQNVSCGYFFVKTEGQYGFLHVYADDKITNNVDEGADPGDTIRFFLNDKEYPASQTGKWTSDGDRIKLDLSFSRTKRLTLNLTKGWNLFSFNVNPSSTKIEDVLKPIEGKYVVVRGFQGSAKTYDPALPEFSDLHETKVPFGYWIKMTEDAQLTIEGNPVAENTSINLTSGWNLIGYLPEEKKSVETALASIKNKLIVARGFKGSAKTYDPALPDFSDLKEMEVGYGYWLKVTEAVTLDYTGAGGGSPAPTILARLDFRPTYLNVDFYGDVYLNGKPAAEGTKIEAFARGVKCGEVIVTRKGRYGFLHVYGDDPLSEIGEGALPGDEIRFKINGLPAETSARWSRDGDRIRLELSATSEIKPAKTMLFQNFPNPFNPETWMPFQLAGDADVSITIFNSSGELVRQINLGALKAGSYTTRETAAYWDGRNEVGERISSGVYFYRFKAGDYEQTRKMIILK